MAYIRVKRGKFKVEINKKGYPRVFKSFLKIKDAKKFAKEVESQMERQVFEDYSGARGITQYLAFDKRFFLYHRALNN